MTTARRLAFFFAAEQETVVEAIAIHARVATDKDKVPQETHDWISASVNVHIKTATEGASTYKELRFPHL
jgi:hypothetical protein